MLEAALVLAAFVAGVTGTWSPCGLSMIETIGPTGHSGGRRVIYPALLTFTLGCLAGGVVTFAGLALLGSLLGGGQVVLAIAAILAFAAALAELRGVRIMPQIRRQVPEHWRRIMPMPVAAGLYGVLLGLGFTTFVLTFGVWALAAISFAVGNAALGLAVGLAFGLGRALPVTALAPSAGEERAARIGDLMMERPVVLRSFRLADGLALGLCALALGTATAEAATLTATNATDPSAAGENALAWEAPLQGAVLREGTQVRRFGGADPALGGPYLAVRTGNTVNVLIRADRTIVQQFTFERPNKLAISGQWLVVRTTDEAGRDTLQAVKLGTGEAPKTVFTAAAPQQISRPSVDGDILLFHIAGRSRSEILQVNLTSGERTTLRRQTRSIVSQPYILGDRFVYLHVTPFEQKLVLAERRVGGVDVVLYKIGPYVLRDAGSEPGGRPHSRYPRPVPSPYVLWTTAMNEKTAYVTRLRRGRAEILSVGLSSRAKPRP